MNAQLDRYLLSGDDLLKAASTETSSEVFAVGGLLCELGLIATPAARLPVPCLVFGRWLELARRARGLTLLDISSQVNVDLHELVRIECGEAACVQPRTVHQLAVLFAVDPRSLAVISGLIQDQPGNPLTGAAVRFAAQSESMEKLSKGERDALNEFVQLLASSERTE